MNKFLKKKAGVWSDYFSSIPTQATLAALEHVPAIGPVAKAGRFGVNAGSLIHGFSQPVSDADIETMDNSVGKALIPGVGASRMIRRMRHSADKTGGAHPTANVVGETFGASVPVLASIIAGAALGGILKARNPMATQHDVAKGSLIGAGIGGGLTGLATLAAWGAAGLTPRRTKAEQKEHDDSTNVSNWLVPGAAAYNSAKRFGRLLDEQDAREAKVAKKASAISKKAASAEQRYSAPPQIRKELKIADAFKRLPEQVALQRKMQEYQNALSAQKGLTDAEWADYEAIGNKIAQAYQAYRTKVATPGAVQKAASAIQKKAGLLRPFLQASAR